MKTIQTTVTTLLAAIIVALFSFCIVTEVEAEEEASVAISRLFNVWTGEHHYTKDANEVSHLVSLGWTDEGVAWSAPATSETPVMRLYNPATGEHHYTASVPEYVTLMVKGWNGEGVAWYADDTEDVTIYRLWNKNVDGAGAHLFTSDYNEYLELENQGWTGEGVGFYASAGAGVVTSPKVESAVETMASDELDADACQDIALSQGVETVEDAPVEETAPSDVSEDTLVGGGSFSLAPEELTELTDRADSIVCGPTKDTEPDEQSSGSGNESKTPPRILTVTPSTSTEETGATKKAELGDVDWRGYTLVEFSHTERRACEWERVSEGIGHYLCVGCGQSYFEELDPKAYVRQYEHLKHRVQGQEDGTSTELGGTDNQMAQVPMPHATAYETKTVVDFVCWATPDGRHDPECRNPEHVVRSDVDEEHPRDISEATVTLDQPSYAYTGEYVCPKVTVTLDGQVLTEDTNYQPLKNRSEGDFHVVYYYNRYKPYAQSHETPLVVVVGQNGYEGSIDVPFTIDYPAEKPNLMHAEVVGDISHFTVDHWFLKEFGWQFKEEMPKLVLDGKTLEYGKDYGVCIDLLDGKTPYGDSTKMKPGYEGGCIVQLYAIGSEYEGKTSFTASVTLEP